MEAQTHWNDLVKSYISISRPVVKCGTVTPDTSTVTAVIVMDNHFSLNIHYLSWLTLEQLLKYVYFVVVFARTQREWETLRTRECHGAEGLDSSSGCTLQWVGSVDHVGMRHAAGLQDAGLGDAGREHFLCWRHRSYIITTLTHTQATSCISVCVYNEQYLNNLRNLCINWRTCHHAVGGLLVAIVTWGHWVVQAGWRITQSRSGQVHMRAFGRLNQWQTWGE